MKNPLKNKRKYHIIIFAMMMTYLLFSIITFIAEFYYRLSDSIPTLRTIWVFEFVDRWHWAFIIAFITYTMMTYLISYYLFNHQMEELYKTHSEMNKTMMNEAKEHFEINNN